ncbi:hypothetical protein [Streptomyces sp. NPDC059788]
MLETGNEDVAQEKLTRLINESKQFKEHAAYPARQTDASATPAG